MSTECCICHKKIGALGYPLIQGFEGLRTCETCHRHIQTIEQSCRAGEANDSLAYLNRFMVTGVSYEVRNRIQSVIRDFSNRVNENANKDRVGCESCGKSGELYRMPVILEDGSNDVVEFCYKCYFKCKESEGIQTRSRGFVKEDTTTTIEPVSTGNVYSDSAYSNVLSGWTSFAKVMNILFLIACFLSGIFTGASIGGGDEEAVIGGLIGAIVGLVAGGAGIAISMVIIEISQNIQRMLVNSNKMLEIMEKNQKK